MTAHPEVKVLDHGYVRFVEAWGRGDAGADVLSEIEKMSHQIVSSDFECGIIEAARQSTQGSFRGWEDKYIEGEGIIPHIVSGDLKLLTFLFNSEPQHAGPFEFAGMIIEVQCPLFVRSEWHRHRTFSYNEMSARYASLPDLYYLPQENVVAERCCNAAKATNKQQASLYSGPVLPEVFSELSKEWLDDLKQIYEACERSYKWGLKQGIPKELARLVMPVGHYTRFRASGTLRNWLQFLVLRMDYHAQWEIRQFAEEVHKIIYLKFPKTAKLFDEKRIQRLSVLRRLKEAEENSARDRSAVDVMMAELKAARQRIAELEAARDNK